MHYNLAPHYYTDAALFARERDVIFARSWQLHRGRWLWMWPNWTLSLFEGGMNTSRINPLAADRTELIYHFYFAADTDTDRAATIARNLAVIEEDFSICIDTHHNYATGAYTPGPLSPRHEQGVAYFQQRVGAIFNSQ